MLAKKTSKNQVTLPRDVVKEFPGIDYFDVEIRDNTILLKPVKVVPVEQSDDVISNIRTKMEKMGVTESDVEDAVRWARKKRR